MTRAVRRLTAMFTWYPVSFTWLTGTSLAAAVSAGLLRADVALALFTLVVIAILLAGTSHEVSTIHVLVNSQHDEMVKTINRMSARIGQLLHALHRAGVPVPDAVDAEDEEDAQEEAGDEQH
jgi:Flp pilus assembly protein TadB